MIKKILAVLSAIGVFFSALFYVLFRQAKDEQKVEKKENEDLKDNLEAIAEAEKAVNKKEKENEKLKEESNNNNLDGFNALNSLLQK